MLIYCVSKLNWRTDAWLQCNKNKVPLLNSLTCFFWFGLGVFLTSFFLPHVPTRAHSVLTGRLNSCQRASKRPGCRRGSTYADISGVFGDPWCFCTCLVVGDLHSAKQGAEPSAHLVSIPEAAVVQVPPAVQHRRVCAALSCRCKSLGWQFLSCDTRSSCFSTI